MCALGVEVHSSTPPVPVASSCEHSQSRTRCNLLVAVKPSPLRLLRCSLRRWHEAKSVTRPPGKYRVMPRKAASQPLPFFPHLSISFFFLPLLSIFPLVFPLKRTHFCFCSMRVKIRRNHVASQIHVCTMEEYVLLMALVSISFLVALRLSA